MRNAAALMIEDVELLYAPSATGPVASGLRVCVNGDGEGVHQRVLSIKEPFSAEGDGSNVSQMLLSSAASGILDGTRPSDAIASNFVEGRHWRFVALVAAEKRCYYWNPYGNALDDDHALHAALREFSGWSLVPIPTALQTDGWNCGPWSHAALELFVSYFKLGVFDGFDRFLASRPELRPLEGLRASKLRAATAINKAFVGNLRDEMRSALQAAHERGEMPFLPLENAPQFFVGEAERRRLRELGASSAAPVVLHGS